MHPLFIHKSLTVVAAASLFATSTFAATRSWSRLPDAGEGFFGDNANWDSVPLYDVDGFRIDFGQAVIRGLDDGVGGITPYVFKTRGNNFIGFNYGYTQYGTLRISNGGTLITSYPELIDGQTQNYELFVGRGVVSGSSNQGRLIMEEGGKLELGYHMAVGRNGGHGRVDMTGGTITRPATGNIYLGWDDNTGQNMESLGEFYQSGGVVNHTGVLYMGTQTSAAGRPSRGYLQLSGNAIFQMASIFVGRQGAGSSGRVEMKDNVYLKANVLMLGGDIDTYKGPYGTFRMTGQQRSKRPLLRWGIAKRLLFLCSIRSPVK